MSATPRLVRLATTVAANPQRCAYSQYAKGSSTGATGPKSPKRQAGAAGAAAPPAGINENVPGLSARCVLPRSQPLGPGASATSEYKVPEYFCYDKTSYAEAEIEMADFRCPQPNANRKL